MKTKYPSPQFVLTHRQTFQTWWFKTWRNRLDSSLDEEKKRSNRTHECVKGSSSRAHVHTQPPDNFVTSAYLQLLSFMRLTSNQTNPYSSLMEKEHKNVNVWAVNNNIWEQHKPMACVRKVPHNTCVCLFIVTFQLQNSVFDNPLYVIYDCKRFSSFLILDIGL